MPIQNHGMRKFVQADGGAASGIDQRYDLIPPGASKFTLQARPVGAGATAWNLVLEGSDDSVNFTTIITVTEANTTAVIQQAATAGAATAFGPFRYVRMRLVSCTLGTDYLVGTFTASL